MSDVKFSLIWAFLGVVLALIAFLFNYTFAPTSIWGYEILAGPAMFSLSFFSEETAFWPKLAIFLFGQYIIYFVALFILKKTIKLTHTLFKG